jgi:hypothetical protein
MEDLHNKCKAYESLRAVSPTAGGILPIHLYREKKEGLG